MALILKPSDIVLTPTGAKALFLDETGDYDETNNPGGYGGLNAARSTLALFMVAVYHALSGDEKLLLDAYDPLDAETEYKVILKNDGWLTVHFLAFTSVASPAPGSYSSGAVLYDSVAGGLVVLSGGVFVPVTDILTHKSRAVGYGKADHFPTPNQYKKLVDINKREIDISFDLTPETECEHNGLIALKNDYYLLETRLGATHYEFLSGNSFVAQRNIEFLNKRL